MTPTPTFNGTIVNLQFVYGGSPTINNYTPPAENPTPARSIHHPSRPYSPSTSNVSDVSATAPDRPTISTSWNHHAQPAPRIGSPSQPLETSLPSANLLSPIGSLMANLDSLQSHALVNHSSSRSLTAESPRVSHFPQPVVYAHSNAGGSRVRSLERVDSDQYHQDDTIANMNGSTQDASSWLPVPYLSPYPFPSPSVDPRDGWPMPEPERFDWLIDERDDSDVQDEGSC